MEKVKVLSIHRLITLPLVAILSRAGVLLASETVDLTQLDGQWSSFEFEVLDRHLTVLQDDANFQFGHLPTITLPQDLVLHSISVSTLPLPISAPVTPILPLEAEQPSSLSSTPLSSSGISSLTNALQESPTTQMETQPQVEPVSFPPFVEAFDFKIPVEGVRTEQVSRDGWQLSFAPLHWSTLSWEEGQETPQGGIPLLSQNTAQILAHLAGVTLQSQAGIVFGQIEPGWSVELSERAEQPILLGEDLQTVSQVSEGRYFIFLNASPGSHLVYFTSKFGKGSGAVALPVLGGTATYLDLSRIESRTLTGTVTRAIDPEVDQDAHVGGAEIRVVGQSGTWARTNRVGRFSLPQVWVTPRYPFFIETDKGSGFTHRYRVLPQKMANLDLVRIPTRQVREWISQLEGGMSQQSGLIVVAVPMLVAQAPSSSLFPSVHPLGLSSSSLVPETYTLSPGGLLQAHAPLGDYESRFVGVEISEGPAIIQLRDQGQNVIWSELSIVSPGVVNVIGPY